MMDERDLRMLARANAEALRPFIDRLKALEAEVAELKARPTLKYMGGFNAAMEYRPGDIVTHAGNMFHCNVANTHERSGTSGSWTLCVRKGQDGKDAKDAR
jgi:hypothetical protein